MTDDPRTAYPALYEQYPELYHEYPNVAPEIYRRIDEHGEEWVLENWERQFLPATPITPIPDKDELPFFDPDEHEAWTDEEKAAMGRAYSAYRENIRKANFGSTEAVRERLADGYVFELTYREDGDKQVQLVTHEGFDRPAANPRDGPTAFRFASLGADEPVTVRLPELVAIEPVPLADLGGPLREKAISSMTNDVSNDPDRVPLATIEETLGAAVDGDIDEKQGVQLAWRTLQVRDTEDALETLGEPLFALLHRADTPVTKLLFTELKAVTSANPTVVEPYVPELVSLLTETTAAAGPASCLATLAEHDPATVLDAAPALAAVAESGDETARKWAVYAFSRLGREHPEALFPALDVLIDAMGADDGNLRTNALSALGTVTGPYPDAAAAVVDDIVALMDSGNPAVRGNAIGLLADIAQEHPEPVIEHAAVIASRLTDESADVRQNAAITLIRAGGADPAAVEAEYEQLEAALDDSDPAVRANACTLVGNTHAPVSRDRLRDLREDDPDSRVRERAAWALDRLP